MTRGSLSHRAAIAMAVLTALALLAAACGGSGSSGSSNDPSNDPTKRTTPLEDESVEPQRGGKVVVAVPAESNGWNPTINQWADAGSLVGSSFMEPLTIVDINGEAQGWLADKWTHNEDFTEWEVTVKPNIKFHNGQPLDGKAVAQNLRAVFTGGLTKVAMESVYESAEESGPLSAKVKLKKQFSQWPASLSNVWVMAPEMLDMPDAGVVNPIGTGPFVFKEWVQNKNLRAVKNPSYWRKDEKGRQLPFLDEIEFKPIVDEATMDQAIQANDIDMGLTTSAEFAARSDEKFNVIRDYNSERTFLMLNTADSEFDGNRGNPFTNIHARKAVAYATDRIEIADQAGQGVISSTQGYRPDSKWGSPEESTGYFPYDPAKAKEEIELYKKDTGKDKLSFTVTGLTSNEAIKILQIAQEQWRQVGMDVKIDNQDQVKYIITIATGAYQAGWFRWYGYLNPDLNYVFHAAEDANPVGQLSINFTHYTSPELQKNLEGGRQTENFEERKKLNDLVTREVNSQAIVVWFYNTPYSLISNKKVKGLNSFKKNPFGNFSPKPWWSMVWIQK